MKKKSVKVYPDERSLCGDEPFIKIREKTHFHLKDEETPRQKTYKNVYSTNVSKGPSPIGSNLSKVGEKPGQTHTKNGKIIKKRNRGVKEAPKPNPPIGRKEKQGDKRHCRLRLKAYTTQEDSWSPSQSLDRYGEGKRRKLSFQTQEGVLGGKREREKQAHIIRKKKRDRNTSRAQKKKRQPEKGAPQGTSKQHLGGFILMDENGMQRGGGKPQMGCR